MGSLSAHLSDELSLFRTALDDTERARNELLNNIRIRDAELANARKWLAYLASCEAATVEGLEQKKSTPKGEINRHRSLLHLFIEALDGNAFERYTPSDDFNERRARSTAEKYPYLPALKDQE